MSLKSFSFSCQLTYASSASFDPMCVSFNFFFWNISNGVKVNTTLGFVPLFKINGEKTLFTLNRRVRGEGLKCGISHRTQIAVCKLGA